MTFNQRKRLVFERDKKCVRCGSTDNLTVDHIIPLSRGGISSLDNLTTLCKKCNVNKSSNMFWSFWERLQMILHVDEIIQKFVNSLKGQISANLGIVRSEMGSLETRLTTKINQPGMIQLVGALNQISVLEARIKSLEEYLKVEYVVETLEFRGYKKLKK